MAVGQPHPVPSGAVFSARSHGGTPILYHGDVAGNMYFVDSNDGSSDAKGTSWNDALTTINAAVDKCTASHGDVVMVHPSHTENLTADSAIDIDLAGVSVIGIRHGRLMPTLTATAAAGDCKLAAAGVMIQNLRFLSGVDQTTGVIEVTGTDCAILDCEFRDSVDQATDGISIVDGADRLLIDGFRYIGAAGAGTNAAFAIDGADDLEIRNFDIYGNFAVGALDFRTTLSARVHVHSGAIWTANAADIGIVDTVGSSTGTIGPDITIVLPTDTTNITEAVTGATFHLVDPVYVVNKVNEKGILINWAVSSD